VTIGGFFRAICRVALVCGGLLGVLALLIHFGVVRNPFGPTISGDVAAARSGKPGLRVLFIGNSFTYMNDLPGVVRKLLNSDADETPAFVVEYTRPGGQLRQAARDSRLAALIGEARWNFVVLQEQSEIPSFPDEQREELMDGYARNLAGMIRADGATPVLFETWGYRNGDRRNVPTDSYDAMQERLDRGVSRVAKEINARVAPVGEAWRYALSRRPNLSLWAGDGKHPSKLGTYLAACVFYTTVSGRSATAAAFRDGIEPHDAALLRAVPARVPSP
jgi:hypothetical protein